MNYKRVFIQNSCVHLIIVAYNRKPIFIDNVDLLQKAIINAMQYFQFEIVAFCILPDHIHIIMKPIDIYEYPKIITSIKYYFSKNFNVGVETPTYGYLNKGEKGIFQRRYYEHTIVSEKDFYTHVDYIHYNPVKHGYVNQVKEWEYSSFRKYIKDGFYDENWCNFGNKNKIKDLNYE